MQQIYSLTGGGHPTQHLFGDRRLLRPTNQALNCPRCHSLNTKFCYYNNYNLSQPRHFCKSCRRYWTNGGVLRNVPVGGCRKSKRPSSTLNSKPSSKPPLSPSLSAANSQPRNDAAVAVTYNNSNGESPVIAAATSPVIPADIAALFYEYSASYMKKPSTVEKLYGIESTAIDHHHGVGRDDVSGGMPTGIRNFPSPFGYGGLMSEQPQDRDIVEGFGALDWEGSWGGDREELFDQWTAADDVVDRQPPQRWGF